MFQETVSWNWPTRLIKLFLHFERQRWFVHKLGLADIYLLATDTEYEIVLISSKYIWYYNQFPYYNVSNMTSDLAQYMHIQGV